MKVTETALIFSIEDLPSENEKAKRLKIKPNYPDSIFQADFNRLKIRNFSIWLKNPEGGQEKIHNSQ